VAFERKSGVGKKLRTGAEERAYGSARN